MVFRKFRIPELGVLLLISAAVAAMVPPVLPKPGITLQDRSLDNLRQLAIGVQHYTEDWGETFPGWVKNPDGRYAHNAWDEQLDPYLKSQDIYNTANKGHVRIRSSADPTKRRVVTYGMNGLLICTPPSFTGSTVNAMAASRHRGAKAPVPLSLSDVSDPAGTILLAELATVNPMPNTFGQAPIPAPYVGFGRTGPPKPVKPSPSWQKAHPGWIDISPREFVETSGKGSYDRRTWDATRGVARDLYGGGGCYAFVDGHVQFMKIGQTVGIGRTVSPAAGKRYKIAPGNTAWNPTNILNQWNPFR